MAAQKARGANFDTPLRGFCTFMFFLLWCFLTVCVIYCHKALEEVTPDLKDLPANLHKGFYEVLKFDDLRTDANSVMTSCVSALSLCSIAPSQCSNLPSRSGSAITATQKAAIEDAFTRTLSTIKTVATDPYFGTPALATAAGQLQSIQDDLGSISGGNQWCSVVNPLYCNIHDQAYQLFNSFDTVRAAIDGWLDTKEVQTWEDYSHEFNWFHVLPYLLVVGMLFFSLFWFADANLRSSTRGVVCMSAFAFCWVVYLIICIVVTSIGYAIRNEPDRIPINGVFAKDTTLRTLLQHIQVNYPEFWALAFADLEAGLKMFNDAFSAFLAFCLCVFVYAVALVVMTPYTESAPTTDKLTDEKTGAAAEDAKAEEAMPDAEI